MANRNYATPRVDAEWAANRETCMPVAVAIHAISDAHRAPEAIWEDPTDAENDHVTMAVEEYLRHGDFEESEDGRYPWGQSAIVIYSAEG
jgi:hypothetical protein